MADNKLDLEENGKYRVAYNLMTIISNSENHTDRNSKPREYYLTLYRQCKMVGAND